MKLIAQVKLKTTEVQFKALKETLERSNDAANALSDFAWNNKIFHQFSLHRAKYFELKTLFSLSAQITIRVISKVANAYKLNKKTKLKFRNHGSIAYDSRILSWKIQDKVVSIWTIDGRVCIPFSCGERQFKLLEYRMGEANLILYNGIFYLNQTCDVYEQPTFDFKEFIGCDLGINNIATTSNGKIYTGDTVKKNRKRNLRLRQKLQKKGSKSAKRLLKKRRRKESRFSKDINHCISKQIVLDAKRTVSVIVFEKLKGIQRRVRLQKHQRYILGTWSFFQLQQFVCYKAKREGIPVIFVDPRNSSRECSCCGHTEKANRPSQAIFSCKKCGFLIHADINAALNLATRGRAIANSPYAGVTI